MNDPELKRVRDLIARATHDSTSDEEARTCALLAVRAIAKHKLTVVRESVQAATPPSTASSPPNASAENGFEDRPYMRNDPTKQPAYAKGIWDIFEKRAQKKGAAPLYLQGTCNRNGLSCAKCGQGIPLHAMIAYNPSRTSTTHFDCRDFFHPHPLSCRCAQCAARKTSR